VLDFEVGEARMQRPGNSSGSCPPLAAPILDLPAERSDAASAMTSNEGWPASAARNCCPTTPVAPMTATVFFITNLHETQHIG
jgi:hypothetical protein